MDDVRSTNLWKRTLGKPGGGARAREFQQKLKSAFVNFRKNTIDVANEIGNDLKELTVHDIKHIDALWETADTIMGDDYEITPTEAFVLGGAFLLHDLGLALASYPGGIEELKETDEWKDAVGTTLRRKLGRSPTAQEMTNPSAELERLATETTLRVRHAKRAEDLAFVEFQHTSRDAAYHLLEDTDLRQAYGRLMGRIAYSHWWSIEKVVADAELNRPVGANSNGPDSWTIRPLKLAILLRSTDACHLDSRRAPGLLRALRKPSGTAALHWRIQELLQKPFAKNQRVAFTSTSPILSEDREAWWIGYELLQIADKELRDAEVVLSEQGLPALAVHGVAGCANPQQLKNYIITDGWIPIDTSIRSTDVGGLVKKIGGEGLYGKNPTVPLRELIQNARDAVVARRIKEGRKSEWGTVKVRLTTDNLQDQLEIDDEGLGMSEHLLCGPLIDFGTSYWDSDLSIEEHRGLISSGFEPQGNYGIGFYSVFMVSDRVRIVTRRPEDSVDETRVLEFEEGLSARPLMRVAKPEERRLEPGTSVTLWLRNQATGHQGMLWCHDYTSEHLDKPESRRKDVWPLADLCKWLCPALDVNLVVETEESAETVIVASDWKSIDAKELIRRLIMHRQDCDEVLSSGVADSAIKNIRPIFDSNNEIIGRAVLTDVLEVFDMPGSVPWNTQYFALPGVRTAGCFRAHAGLTFRGLLIGRPNIAARTDATPLAFDFRKGLSDWATQQAQLLRGTNWDFAKLSRIAQIVRLLGGDTSSLPIAEYQGQFVSFYDIVRHELPDVIELHETQWSVTGYTPFASDLPANAIAVGTGRMRALYGIPDDGDLHQRANHPRWSQYWLSLWGATIEAIAIAWGCRLQDVLEASTINAKGSDEVEGGIRPLVDTIRKPSV